MATHSNLADLALARQRGGSAKWVRRLVAGIAELKALVVEMEVDRDRR